MIGKYFQIYCVHILRKYTESRHFYSCLYRIKTHPPSSCNHTLGRKKLLIPSDSIFENLFPLTTERGEGNCDLLCQISIRRHEDDLEYYIIYILCDL